MRDLSILPADFFDFFVGVDFSTFFSSLTLTTDRSAYTLEVLEREMGLACVFRPVGYLLVKIRSLVL